METSDNIFVWTEAFGCGEMLPAFTKSYLAHHTVPIYIFGQKNDFSALQDVRDSKLLRFIAIDEINSKYALKIKNAYLNGHSGTALIWTYLLKSQKEKWFIHLDSDIIFLENSVDIIIKYLIHQNKSLVGSRRAYKNRTYRKNGLDGFFLDHRPDVVNTYCFGFDSSFIKKIPAFYLKRMIEGKRTSLLPVVDFFDSVSFRIMKKSGGNVKYLESTSPEAWSDDVTGGEVLENRMLVFHGVGSGINFYKNPQSKTSPGYRNYALASYRQYASLFLSQIPEISQEIADLPMSAEMAEKLRNLDKSTWRIR